MDKKKITSEKVVTKSNNGVPRLDFKQWTGLRVESTYILKSVKKGERVPADGLVIVPLTKDSSHLLVE